MTLTTDFAVAEQLVRELQTHAIEIDPAVERALSLYGAAASARLINPEAELRAAFMSGTPHLRHCLSSSWLAPAPSSPHPRDRSVSRSHTWPTSSNSSR